MNNKVKFAIGVGITIFGVGCGSAFLFVSILNLIDGHLFAGIGYLVLTSICGSVVAYCNH